MRIIPETTRITIGGILIGLTIVIGAFVTIILHRTDRKGHAERAIHIEVNRIRDSKAPRRIWNAGAQVDGVDILSGIIGPANRLAGVGKRHKSVSRSLKFRAGVRSRRRIRQIIYGRPTAKRPDLRLITHKGRHRANGMGLDLRTRQQDGNRRQQRRPACDVETSARAFQVTFSHSLLYHGAC